MGKPFWSFFTILNSLKIVWKIVWRMVSKMIWLYKFWGGIKILYRDLESWKKWLKKVEWNGMVLRIEKSEKIKWNGMGRMAGANIRLFLSIPLLDAKKRHGKSHKFWLLFSFGARCNIILVTWRGSHVKTLLLWLCGENELLGKGKNHKKILFG